MAGVLDNTFGATLIGVMLATFAYGIATIQLYGYLNTHRDDSRSTHLYVLALWSFDTLKVICICHMQYYYTISSFGNFPALLSTTWSLSLAVCMTTVTTFMVQSFIARRTWNFARRVRSSRVPPKAIKVIGAAIAMASLAQLAFGLVSTALAWKVRYFIKATQYRWLGIGWLGSAAVCDILLVCSLTTTLATQRTGFKRTDVLINRIILFTINTGLLTSVVATTNLILFCSMPNLIHFIPNFLLGTLYIITLLATLHTGGSSNSPTSNSTHSRTPPHTGTKWNGTNTTSFVRGKGSGIKDIGKTGSQGSELVRVQIDRETCVHGSSLSVGQSRLSGDEDAIKCYDAGDKLHALS